MKQTVAQEELDRLVEAEDWEALSRFLEVVEAPDAAHVLIAAPEAERLRMFERMPADEAVAAFAHLPIDEQRRLIETLPEEKVRTVVNELAPDDRTRLLEEMPEAEMQRMLTLLSIEHRREALHLLQYPERSAGRLMSPQFVSVFPFWTIERAIAHLRMREIDPGMAHTVYVVDRQSRLIDAIGLPHIVLAEPTALVEDVMDRTFVALSPEDDREEAVRLMLEYDAAALPVTNAEGVLLGVVTFDDVMDVAEEEATEDIQLQAGVGPLHAPYPEVRTWSLFVKRIPWLAALILVYLVASGVVSAFEDALAAQVILASFIPMLMGSGGNVGAQSGTLTVRAMATGELEGRTWLRALAKETSVGLGLGVSLAVLAGLIGHYRGGYQLALVVGLAMLLIVFVANLFGILLPLLLERAGVDPAVAGSPVITSLTDITSLVIYFTVATRMLGLG